jgi:hypothetical protein
MSEEKEYVPDLSNVNEESAPPKERVSGEWRNLAGKMYWI